MLKVLLSTTAILVGVCGIVSAAQAADLPQRPVKMVSYNKPKEFEGFYLRGDVGYAVPAAPTGVMGAVALSHEDLGNAWLVGGGVGYTFNENFRADVTIDHQFKSKYKSQKILCGCSIDNAANFTTTTILANGYYDFGNFSGITPYIGAGVGVAHNSMSKWIDTTSGVGTAVKSDSVWGLAAAAMAGVSYSFTSNMMMDLNYRFLWLDQAQSGLMSGSRYELSDIYEHQVRIGLRYMFQ